MRKLFFSIVVFIVVTAGLASAAFADAAGDAYERGQIAWENQDYQTAYREYAKAGELGHLDAQILLAINLSLSPYREDFLESRKWWAKAAGQGNTSSMVALGDSYRQGNIDGNFIDYREAIKWYRTASASKNREHAGEAFLSLGEMYEAGQGTGANPSQALKFYKKAADCGNGEAKYRIGLLYETGKGVGRNYGKAREWYAAAARDWVSSAMYRIGYLHEKGLGVKAGMKEAEKWYRKAADAGHNWSQFYFGDKCEFGKGTPEDLVSAYVWYSLAARGRGSEELWKKAKAAKERVALKLSPGELTRAAELVKKWRPRR